MTGRLECSTLQYLFSRVLDSLSPRGTSGGRERATLNTYTLHSRQFTTNGRLALWLLNSGAYMH
jgi:hypothetical protein